MKKINVALVGLGFGGAFLPIYKEHPLVGKIKIFTKEIREGVPSISFVKKYLPSKK